LLDEWKLGSLQIVFPQEVMWTPYDWNTSVRMILVAVTLYSRYRFRSIKPGHSDRSSYLVN